MLKTTECHAQSIMDKADTLAHFSSDEGALTRGYLTKEHKAAHQQLAIWMEEAGLTTWEDSVGNQWGRKAASNPDAPTVIIGSHSDTVTNAGKYDGNLGILLGIETLKQLSHHEFPFNIDVVAFADEEGLRFDTTLIGSSAVAGQFNAQWFDIKDPKGITMAQAMQDFGLLPSKAGLDCRDPKETLAYLEVHIEQGPVLEAQDLAVGVVTGIAGAKRFKLDVSGMAGHAGTVPLPLRHDALCAVAEMISTIETYAKENDIVATVGKCDVKGGAVNVIPGDVSFTIDIRSLEQAKLESACEHLLEQLESIAEYRNVDLGCEQIYQADAVKCAPSLQSLWGNAVEVVTQSSPYFLPSGAGHDALAMQHLTNVGMLFVRCEKGISHNPKEAVMTEDVQVALQCVMEMLLQLESNSPQ
ncbi:allantoate amidohydrolase [Vibrio astriarenae]